MTSSSLAPSFRGAAIASTVGMIANYTPFVAVGISVALAQMSADNGWGRDMIPAMMMITSLVGAVSSPIYGRLLDKYPVHWVAAPATAACGLGIFLLGALPANVALYYGVFVLFGASVMAPLIAIPKVMTAWSGARPGLTIGLFFGASGSAGMAIAPLLAGSLITLFGWRGSFEILGAIVMLVTAPITYLFLRMPAQATRTEPVPSIASEVQGDGYQNTSRLRGIVGNRAFLPLILSVGLFWLATQGLRVHFVALATDRGISIASASNALALMGACGFIGNISIGWLMDRFPAPRIVVPFFLLAAFGVGMIALANSPVTLLLGAAIIGFGIGAEMTVAPVLTRRYFPTALNGEVYGYVQTSATFASSIGPWIMGRSYEGAGSYGTGIAVIGGALVLGALLVALLPAYVFRAK